MLFFPDDSIGIIRKTVTEAEKCVNSISAIMKMGEIREIFKAFHGVYPEFTIDRSNMLQFNFKKTIETQGNVNAFGIMNSCVGAHVKRAIFDDFVTIDDKISKAVRLKTNLFLEEYLNNILAPHGTFGCIGTPWHDDDAWQLCPIPEKHDVYSTGLLTPEEIRDKKAKTTYPTFSANYELVLTASGERLFKDPKYAKWEYRYRHGIGHIDKKYTGIDTNALTFIAQKSNGRYQVYGKIFNENIKTLYDEIQTLHKKYFIGSIHSETNDDKGFVSDKLKDMGIPVKPYTESTNKHIKIVTHLKENGFFDLIDFDPETDTEYINQILDYTEGSEPDDAPDSLASIGRVLIKPSTKIYKRRWKL